MSAMNNFETLNPESRAWHERARNILVGGGQAHRRSYKYTLRGGPEFAVRAKGAHFWDVDGRRYLDYLMSYGPILIGHADERVNAAVARQMAEGSIFSLEHPAVIELAETLCGIVPCAERVAFLVGGSSATTAAVRCARVHTRREKIVRCGYHGWFDWCFPEDIGAPPSQSGLTISVPYNDLAALERAFAVNKGEVACFILEAWQGDGPAAGYASGVRRLCDEYGVLFILDEVKTGFRFGLGGVQERLGVDADMATFGKAMCNGYPGSVLAGKAIYLAGRSDTFIGATFHGDLLSVAAANEVIAILRETNGLEHIERLGRQLIDGINERFARTGFPMLVGGHPVMPELRTCPADHPDRPLPEAWRGKPMTEWCAAMMRRQVFMTGHVWFISLAHTDEDIQHTIDMADDAAVEARDIIEGIIEGTIEELPYG